MDQLQASVLRALMTKAGWLEYSSVVAEDVFSATTVRALYMMIARLHAGTEGNVTPDLLRMDIAATYRQGETRADEFLTMVAAIEEAPEVEDDALRNAIQRFCSREYLAQASRYIASTLGGEKPIDLEHVSGLVGRAVDIGEKVDAEVLDLDAYGLPGEVDDRPGVCSLGLSGELDRRLGGGVGSGELLVLLAPPARGKTTLLCGIGARAAQAGKGVLHVTLEVSARRVARRYDSTLCGASRDQLTENPKLVTKARAAMAEAGGSVFIKDWSYVDVTPTDVKSLVRQLRRKGHRVDMVIVDYLELLAGDRNQQWRREVRHVYGVLAKTLRSAAVALEIPMITAWQVNRDGSDADQITAKQISESWDVVKHADIILALNQGPNEYKHKLMRIGIIKQRDNTDRGMVEIHADMDRCVFRDVREKEGFTDATTDVTVGGDPAPDVPMEQPAQSDGGDSS